MPDDSGVMPWTPGVTAPPPPDAPPDVAVWTLVLRGQSARAVVREYPHGRELRVLVTSRLLWSQLFRQGDAPTLEAVADEHLAAFIGRGWAVAE